MLLGLMGVGKTVLLVRILEIAEGEGYLTSVMEAPEDRRLARLFVPKMRALLYKLSALEKARTLSNKALGALPMVTPHSPCRWFMSTWCEPCPTGIQARTQGDRFRGNGSCVSSLGCLSVDRCCFPFAVPARPGLDSRVTP
jgi:hypothetical protein